MTSFKTIGRGLLFAGSTLALSSTIAISSNISSAQALTFTPGVTSVLNLSGGVNVINPPSSANPAPPSVTIEFFDALVANNSSNDFISLRGTNATISDLFLTNPVADGSGFQYNGTTINPFLQLAENVRFEANVPFDFVSRLTPSGTNSWLADPITGTFFDTLSGEALAVGNITANQFGGDGSFSATIFATAPEAPGVVPEPTATIALGVIGMGAFFTKNNLAKKKKVAADA